MQPNNNVPGPNIAEPPRLKGEPLSPYFYQARVAEPRLAIQIATAVNERLEQDIGAFHAPPDIWHNYYTVVSNFKMDEEAFRTLTAALRQWPEDVDILCDLLQEYYNTASIYYEPARAAEVWKRLEGLPRPVTSSYWRFWVFGAIFNARIARDPAKALALLEEGLLYVRRDGLQDILRNYRSVIVDSIPFQGIRDLNQMIEYQTRAYKLLEERYKLGIALGVEDGYVLASELARLYQERAAVEASRMEQAGAQQIQERVGQDLDRALTYLRVAEELYTGDTNHPIQTIYQTRIRILMAQNKYGEALRLLKSLPDELRNNESNSTMLRLATLSIGSKLPEEEDEAVRQRLTAELRERLTEEARKETQDSVATETLTSLFSESGQRLFALARGNAGVAEVVIDVARKLTGGGDG